jgi:predicted metal-dependent hydrolase
MNLVEFLIVVLGIAYLMFYVKEHYAEVEYVKSGIDGREYLVRNLPDRKEAADMLARLNKKLLQLKKHMLDEYPHDKDVKRIDRNFNPDKISEGNDDNSYTSYSVNKGEQIVFCIRSRENNALEDENTLTYVAIHELAHLMTAEIGHTDTFWKNFRRLLEQAVNIGLYQQVDYSKKPVKYCGINITSTVLRDVKK